MEVERPVRGQLDETGVTGIGCDPQLNPGQPRGAEPSDAVLQQPPMQARRTLCPQGRDEAGLGLAGYRCAPEDQDTGVRAPPRAGPSR